MTTTLSYPDPETSETISLDLTGWQFVIDTANGEVCRMDFPMLALLVLLQANGKSSFRSSLLSPGGDQPLLEKPEYWLDVIVEKK